MWNSTFSYLVNRRRQLQLVALITFIRLLPTINTGNLHVSRADGNCLSSCLQPTPSSRMSPIVISCSHILCSCYPDTELQETIQLFPEAERGTIRYFSPIYVAIGPHSPDISICQPDHREPRDIFKCDLCAKMFEANINLNCHIDSLEER